MIALSSMSAFLENPMLFLVDDAESILPIFRSTDYTGRIVELADVGCDTETTFPIHFPRVTSDRRRGGAESLKSNRRISEWFNDESSKFTRRTTDINNNELRNSAREKRRDDYEYLTDVNYDNSENYYDVFELSKNDSAEEDDCYPQSVNSRNAYSNRKQRYNYFESSFPQSNYAIQRESISPQWFAEDNDNDIRNVHDTDVQLDERKKRPKTFLRINRSFNREPKFQETRDHEQDLPEDPASSVKNVFWDFIPFENNVDSEETSCYNSKKKKNPGRLQKMTLRKKKSYTFDSRHKCVNTTDSEEEEEFKELLKKNFQQNLSPEITINRRYPISKSNTKETSNKARLNTPNTISPRSQSIKVPIDKQISNTSFKEKNSINTRHSATEGRKIKSATTARKEEITTARTTVEGRRYRDKFDKFSNNSFKENDQSAKAFNRIADTKSNGLIHMVNKTNNRNTRENFRSNQINVASRLTPEKKIKDEEIFSSRTTDDSTDIEQRKEKKFFSRLPVRTWKRLRTKEPAALRPENNAMNEDINRNLQKMENGTAKSNDHLERAKNDNVHTKDPIAGNRNDIKRSQHFETRSLSTDKPELTFSNLKNTKGVKGVNTTRETLEQRKKKATIK